MNKKTAIIISLIAAGIFGIGIYAYRRKKRVKNFQQKVTQAANQPIPAESNAGSGMYTKDWLLGGN